MTMGRQVLANSKKLLATIGFVASLCAAGLVLGSGWPAHAAPASTQITVAPTTLHVALKPGDVHSGTFAIFNSGTTDYTAQVYAVPYTMTDETYAPNFTTRTTHSQIVDWVSFEQTTVRLKAGETVRVAYTITVPKDVPSGGQYAAIFAETEPEKIENSAGALSSKKRAGVLLRANVAGQTRIAGEVLTNTIPGWQSGSFRASTQVKNTGNTDQSATVERIVTTVSGKEFSKDKKDYIVYPDTTRRINTTWDGPTLGGLYKITQNVTFLGTTNTTTTTVIYFTPIGALLSGAVSIFLIGGTIYGLRRYNHARQK